MEPDFSGWATKAGIKCTDGRTIGRDAFRHQDELTVPLVWQHCHNDPENVLGHVILKNHPEGVRASAFFNSSPKAQHARGLVQHKDINSLSIWANQLIERAGLVLHGVIREVSLVLSGANPGALIDTISLRHADGSETDVEDEAIIYTGLELELQHASNATEKDDNMAVDEKTVQDVYESLSDEQKEVVHFMIGTALEEAGSLGQSAFDPTEFLDNLNEKLTAIQEGITMSHNVFEQEGIKAKGQTLSHAEVMEIVAAAKKGGSLKDAVADYALAHGIENIDIMFPDAVAIDGATPEFLKRRTEWATKLLGGVRKSPFSRIRTLYADLTFEDARAKGYVKGTLKKEEFFNVSKRETTPTTIYKKQQLDRDDIVDITDFDVVAWLKGEMRLMLDEELARAILIGDGRDIAHADKINEQNIRPIASDHELFTTQIYVNIDDASSNMQEVIDSIIMNRRYYKGTGLPTMFTTETYISRLLLLRDTTGRRIYSSLADVAQELRVAEIIGVEVMEEVEDLVAVIVNPVDYVVGATRGGEVNMFDDFDIDYNQQKYLIETRCCGAMVKLKGALAIRKTVGTNVLVIPASPTFNPVTGALTIVNQTGVVYKHGATVVNALGSPYTVPAGTSWVIDATPDAGYYFSTSEDDSWTFEADPA